jgi:hypothetical protein
VNTLDQTSIEYNRENHDYDILVAGIAVASAPDYRKAEEKRTHILAGRRDEGLDRTATELDGGAVNWNSQVAA